MVQYLSLKFGIFALAIHPFFEKVQNEITLFLPFLTSLKEVMRKRHTYFKIITAGNHKGSPLRTHPHCPAFSLFLLSRRSLALVFALLFPYYPDTSAIIYRGFYRDNTTNPKNKYRCYDHHQSAR